MAHSPPPPPLLHAYWFYTSSLPIDDPLAPLPTAPVATRLPPRPFSRYDSTALEAAYRELLNEYARRAEHGSGPGTPVRASSKRSSLTKSQLTALEGHPVLLDQQQRGEVRAQDEVASTTESVPPIPRKSLRRSSSPVRGMFSLSSSSASPVNLPETNAINTTPTRNPFIRSLSLARSSAVPPSLPETPTKGRSRRSSMSSTRKEPLAEKEVPVGVQRLHKVLLPSFVMTPIYWSPLHDVASVVRGTWFYKDTMLPVETEIANRLEAGWEEVRAWTEEWDLELQSAVEVGREGEEKVRWQLWDKASIVADASRPGSSGEPSDETQTLDPVFPTTPTKTPMKISSAGPVASGEVSKVKPNEWDWVLFADAKDAFICRDSMLSFGNKRPLASIRRGKTVGTHVVRGFSEDEWLKLYPPKRGTVRPSTRKGPSDTAPNGRTAREKARRSALGGGPAVTSADFQAGGAVGGFTQQQEEGLGVGENEEERGKVTDLFLVIHGIGQKLSERVESFHFTHSINAFRRLVNVELRNEAARQHLRPDVGVMVLPINWRQSLSFDDGIDGSASTDSPTEGTNMFSLNDITPHSIPAVRNLIGDVMLDIPYYLSHHKQKMVKAVIGEANRVYQLWCKNNPGFEKEGRVHIVAHSLGTAISLDILSNQPTHTTYSPEPPSSAGGSHWKRKSREIVSEDEHFAFNTTNVFFAGSPAAFFLLLNRSSLLPRRGRKKPGTFGEDLEPGVGAEVGKYGCMAVDNVYNILHYSDPIAYRMTPTVDPEFAETLKTAHLPSSSASFLDALSSTLRYVLPGSGASSSAAALPIAPLPTRLPSNMELETHDFSREGLAEKRLYLLNDNGQLDWYLNVSRPLESQYLNMLGAHSSYWESRDFARMLVVEAGRNPGRNGTIEAMRVQKKRGFFSHALKA